jgi:hypothetical protein
MINFPTGTGEFETSTARYLWDAAKSRWVVSSVIAAPPTIPEEYNTYNNSPLTFNDAHNNAVIISTNTSGIIYTVPTGLTSGFSCSVIQYATGLTNFSGAPGTTLSSYGSLTGMAGQYASAYIKWISGEIYLLAGNLA